VLIVVLDRSQHDYAACAVEVRDGDETCDSGRTEKEVEVANFKCLWVCLCKFGSVEGKGALLQSLLLVPDLVLIQ